MKTLVIVTHPSIEASVINRRWVEELKKYPEKYTIHELHKVYPDGNIDVEKEQHFIESHSNLILQFPVYWFNSPPLLKKWLDDVFVYGWAHGSNGGDKLKNRKVALAVSAGSKKKIIVKKEDIAIHLSSYYLLFETTFLYCNADYRSFFAFYGTEKESGENEIGTSESELEKSARDYLNFIDSL